MKNIKDPIVITVEEGIITFVGSTGEPQEFVIIEYSDLDNEDDESFGDNSLIPQSDGSMATARVWVGVTEHPDPDIAKYCQTVLAEEDQHIKESMLK